jgi:hypothetical protein
MFIEFVNTRGTTTNNWFPTTCHLRYKVFNKNEIKMRSEDGLSFNGIVALYIFGFWWTLEVMQNMIHTDNYIYTDEYIYLRTTFTNLTNMYTLRTYFWTHICVHLCTLFPFLSFIQYLIHKKNTSLLPCTKIHTRRLHFHVRLMMIIYPFEGSICIFFFCLALLFCAIKLSFS